PLIVRLPTFDSRWSKGSTPSPDSSLLPVAGRRPANRRRAGKGRRVIASLGRYAAPGRPCRRARGGAVDGLTVDEHPAAHILQPVNYLWRNGAVRLRSDVEQVIAALRSDVNQVAKKLLGALPMVVVALVAPRVIDRHARFPVAAGAGIGNFLLGSAE